MSSYYYPKPKLVERPIAPKVRNETCKKITYRAREAVECGAPTDGKVYCPSCAHHLLTLTDRTPAHQQPEPKKPYRWDQEIWKRKRA